MPTRCQKCAPLTLEGLVDLAKKEFEGDHFPRRWYYKHHDSFTELEAAARAGCDLCSLIAESVTGSFNHEGESYFLWRLPFRHWEAAPPPGASTMYQEVLVSERTNIKLCISSTHPWADTQDASVQPLDVVVVHIGPVWKDTDEADTISISETSQTQDAVSDLSLILTMRDGPLPTIRGNPIGRVRIDEDLGSSSNLNTIRSWYSECQHSHPVCWPSNNPDMPTRVVDVGSGGALPDTVRVVSTSGLRQRYAALSHCWGGKIEHVLQESNLDQFQSAIPCLILARNFRDAITITRSLGLRYLWIDSLCIIQDSVADWERESQKMTAVYRDAAVTIYAAESKGSTEGILIRSPEFLGPPPVALKISADATDDAEMTVSRMDESSTENLFRLTNFSHLAKRGWCLQEEMLSPRRLTFGRFGAYWQCPHAFRATNGLPPGGVNQYPERLPSLSSVLHAPAVPTPRDTVNTPVMDSCTLLREYYGMVASYCGRRLTVPSDKLPALAGVVAALSGVLGQAGDEALYLAGIWRQNMAMGLLWRFDGGSLMRAPDYRAPSWSWASVDGEVIFDLASDEKPYKTTEWDLKIVEVRITLRNPLYRFGEVPAGFLDVRGSTLPLVRSTRVVDQAACRPFTLGYCSFDWLPDGHGEHSLFKVIGDKGVWLASIRTQFVYLELEPPTDVLDEALEEEHCFAREYKVIILKVEDDATGSKFGRGLVLLRQENSQNYERVGCVEKVDLSDDWMDEWDYEELMIV